MILGLHHLVLFCRDTGAARSWYEKAGFEYVQGREGMHWFRLGEAQVMLHPADRSSGRSGAAYHAAVSDVEAHFRLVRERGLTPIDHQRGETALDAPVTRPWGDREFELEDPEGHRWAFTQR